MELNKLDWLENDNCDRVLYFNDLTYLRWIYNEWEADKTGKWQDSSGQLYICIKTNAEIIAGCRNTESLFLGSFPYLEKVEDYIMDKFMISAKWKWWNK